MRKMSPLSVFFALLLSLEGASAQDKSWGPPPSGSIQLIPRPELKDAVKPHSEMGLTALKIDPAKWKHAETEHFILHYRRATEAQKVAREIEYNLWYVTNTLGATKDQIARKSHVYIFKDEKEWKEFVYRVEVPSWSASFAYGDDLFLHVGGAAERFDSQRLSHETTHAIVARLYPHRPWPLWLNEGFAEYMEAASIAARKGQYLKGLQKTLTEADLSLEELVAMKKYPDDPTQVTRLYQTSERLVRFLMTKFPKERFPKFVEANLEGKGFEEAVMAVYGDLLPDFETFKKQYAKFHK